MKSLWTMLIQSLQLPRKQAVFALNRLGMDTTVFYLFIIIAIASIPSFFEQMAENERLSAFFFFIFFFIFHYLVVLIVVFVFLSLFAWIFSFITKLVKRKLRYSILWKMAASSATIPILLFTIVSIFNSVQTAYLIVSIVFMALIVTKVIFIYPKRAN